jgi:hypothetical protein
MYRVFLHYISSVTFGTSAHFRHCFTCKLMPIFYRTSNLPIGLIKIQNKYIEILMVHLFLIFK